MKILFAEDEEVVRIVGAEVLASAGFEVLVAADGRRAIELFDRYEQEWSAAVLDLVMPFVRGEKVLDHIRERRPELPVIIASGCLTDELGEHLADRRIAGILHKPYPCDELALMVSKILGTAPPADAD